MTFLSQMCSKVGFAVRISKIIPGTESPLPSNYECRFSDKTENFEFFDLYLGKLPNYVRYFGSYNVEGVQRGGWRLKLGGWSLVIWVEVNGAGWRCMNLDGGGCTV